jgi:hypothetical protein
MKTKNRVKTFFVLIAFSLLSCLAVFGVNRYRVLNGPCVPIAYPDGEPTLDHNTFETQASFETVLEFYNEELDTLLVYDSSIEADSRWFLEKRLENRILYDCNGVEGNQLNVAIGCINIIDHGEKVTIETFFYRSGDRTPCEVVDFEIVPSQ